MTLTSPADPRTRSAPPPRVRPRQRRRRVLAVLTATAALVSGVLVVVGHRRTTAATAGPQCSSAAGTAAQVSPTQAANAATITAVAIRRGLPVQAATIALATAFQESDLQNLSYGDRDSLGLFQQRPSQGWGTQAEVMDPVHASGAFYDALTQVRGYGSMAVTAAAQAVQRSATPDAYARHEAPAQALALALTGQDPAAFNCVVAGHLNSGDPDTVAGALATAFGPAIAVDRPVPGQLLVRANDAGRSWAIADWLLTRAPDLGIAGVAVDGRTWSARDSSRGWTQARGGPPGDVLTVSLAS